MRYRSTSVRESPLCYSGVHSSGQGPQAAARLNSAYRRSRLTMNRAQLIDDFKFPIARIKNSATRPRDLGCRGQILIALQNLLQARNSRFQRV